MLRLQAVLAVLVAMTVQVSQVSAAPAASPRQNIGDASWVIPPCLPYGVKLNIREINFWTKKRTEIKQVKLVRERKNKSDLLWMSATDMNNYWLEPRQYADHIFKYLQLPSTGPNGEQYKDDWKFHFIFETDQGRIDQPKEMDFQIRKYCPYGNDGEYDMDDMDDQDGKDGKNKKKNRLMKREVADDILDAEDTDAATQQRFEDAWARVGTPPIDVSFESIDDTDDREASAVFLGAEGLPLSRRALSDADADAIESSTTVLSDDAFDAAFEDAASRQRLVRREEATSLDPTINQSLASDIQDAGSPDTSSKLATSSLADDIEVSDDLNNSASKAYMNTQYNNGNQGWNNGNQGWNNGNQGWNNGNQGWNNNVNQGWNNNVNQGWNNNGNQGYSNNNQYARPSYNTYGRSSYGGGNGGGNGGGRYYKRSVETESSEIDADVDASAELFPDASPEPSTAPAHLVRRDDSATQPAANGDNNAASTDGGDSLREDLAGTIGDVAGSTASRFGNPPYNDIGGSNGYTYTPAAGPAYNPYRQNFNTGGGWGAGTNYNNGFNNGVTSTTGYYQGYSGNAYGQGYSGNFYNQGYSGNMGSYGGNSYNNQNFGGGYNGGNQGYY